MFILSWQADRRGLFWSFQPQLQLYVSVFWSRFCWILTTKSKRIEHLWSKLMQTRHPKKIRIAVFLLIRKIATNKPKVTQANFGLQMKSGTSFGTRWKPLQRCDYLCHLLIRSMNAIQLMVNICSWNSARTSIMQSLQETSSEQFSTSTMAFGCCTCQQHLDVIPAYIIDNSSSSCHPRLSSYRAYLPF